MSLKTAHRENRTYRKNQKMAFITSRMQMEWETLRSALPPPLISRKHCDEGYCFRGGKEKRGIFNNVNMVKS